MITLYLIRHGPTPWTEQGRIQGRRDLPLSPQGRTEVARWRLPAATKGAVALTSPLRRASETAALLGLKDAQVEPRLVEMDWGDWEGHRIADLRRSLGPVMAAAEARGLDLRPPKGESPRDVQARLADLLGDLATAGTPAVAVTHKGVIRAALALATGWDMTVDPPVKLRDGRCHAFGLSSGGKATLTAANLPLVPDHERSPLP